MGGLGREGLFTIATDGNLQKQFYMPTINVSLFAISGTIMTKLDSFILQRYGKFTEQCLNLH